MRDLKRANAKTPAYKQMRDRGIEVFTPMKWRITMKRGRRIREEVPFVRDLLFVHATRVCLDPIVENTPTLQYRWLRNTYRRPMTVSETDMERFIRAAGADETPEYYLPAEITPSMYGRKIRIVGGPLDGYEGCLITRRGSRVKRLLVELPMLLSVGVEVNPDYIQLIK